MVLKLQGVVKVKGVQHVLRNMTGARATIGHGLERGLKKGGSLLQAESQKIVPVQLGDLQGSAFTRQLGSGLRTDVVVGYTTEYAAYVHEDPDKAHGREFNRKHAAEIAHAKENNLKAATAQGGMFERGENQTFKFLEKPAKSERKKILAIIAWEGRRP